MSNIRDLQKLRNTRHVGISSYRNSKQVNPEAFAWAEPELFKPFEVSHTYLYSKELISHPKEFAAFVREQPIGPRDLNSQKRDIYAPTRELLLLSRQSASPTKEIRLVDKEPISPTRDKKLIHRRGNSIGSSSQHSERPSRNAPSPSPGISIYNFSLKLGERRPTPLSIRKEPESTAENSPRRPERRISLHKPQAIDKNSFNIVYPVGKGGFGKVWKVQMKKTKVIYAMKQMFKAKIIERKSIHSVVNERNLLAKIRHPFIVNMQGAFQDRQNLYLLMDYVDGGDLRYHVGCRQRFTEKETKFFMCNLIIGLEYLHLNKIIHRDIKPENLVMDSTGYIRITDLGVSREVRDENYQDTSGTPGYMAPEVMCRKNHSYEVDYFALGVIGYQFMLGKRPYHGANRKEIKEQIMARQASIRLDELPFKWSPHAADFINRLLIRNADNRLGAKGIDEIKSHRWLADVDWSEMEKKKIKAPFVPKSIEDNYEQYKEQISEDSVLENLEENNLMLRDPEVQLLFEGYSFEGTELRKSANEDSSARRKGYTNPSF